MNLLAIDPGNIRSSFVVFEGEREVPLARDTCENRVLVDRLLERDFGRFDVDHVAIEMIASYGMPVGKTVFETCLWIGRFVQAWRRDDRLSLVYRHDVKMQICRSMRAKDANIRQALIDRFGAPGTKKAPGALYGIHGDEWAALAVAVAWVEMNRQGVLIA